MKRLSMLLAGLLLLLAGPVYGHSISLVVMASLTGPDHVTVKLVDAYTSPIEGAAVTIRSGAPGAKPGKPVKLVEESPGVYTGKIGSTATSQVDVAVEAVLNTELFRANISFDPAQGVTAVTRAMVPIDEPQQLGFPWSSMLMLAAALVLVVGTVIALVRRPAPEAE